MSEYLDVEEVLEGYRRGVFPMGYADAPVISWHLPERRGILPLEGFHVSRSLERVLKAGKYRVSVNEDFRGVMEGCSRAETGPEHTWITGKIMEVYEELHRRGRAHSVEIWVDGELAGGTYGVHIGAAFFAESKFHRVRDMSKVALAELVKRLREREFQLLDVQYWTEHLSQFGVVEVDRNEYYRRLREAVKGKAEFVGE